MGENTTKIRWGLCCIFKEQPIRFRKTTATFLSKSDREDQLGILSRLILHNVDSLTLALEYCHDHAIGDFRINSQIFPLKTHPVIGYDLSELPDNLAIISGLDACRVYAGDRNIRLGLHPDQFTLLSSPDERVTENAIRELTYHAEFAALVGADVINIHGGGAYGDKASALARVRRNIGRLNDTVRSRLTLENDDRVYTPEDLLPVCRDMEVPLVYDIHHHRCLIDGDSEESATQKALATWNREPLFHISSPAVPWGTGNVKNHADYIDVRDIPSCWLDLEITVEVEAKAKELAVLQVIDTVGASRQ
jgi:UV DNA damage endonuclease